MSTTGLMRLNAGDRYRAGDTPLHRLDPRVKLVVALVLIVGIVLTPIRALPAYPLLWALVASLAIVGHVGVWRLARLGGIALPFALAGLTLLFTTPGQPIATINGLTISDAGALRFASLLIKSWLAVQVSILLSKTTPFTDLLWALQSLGVPATLVLITAFLYRYLFTLNDEADRLRKARAARSARGEHGRGGGRLMWRAQVAGGMIGSLFLRSTERSERVYAAMLARGFTGQLRIADPPPLSWRAALPGLLPLLGLAIIEGLALLWWNG
ncbi:MAG: cobalt ECF transporter T component CbiQ [Anaerolineae bacterium]|nr:cobalt ECF transporter T component CbiQ [Anaerolineae bacterium]